MIFIFQKLYIFKIALLKVESGHLGHDFEINFFSDFCHVKVSGIFENF